MSVTIDTKCYERDFRRILGEGGLKEIIERNRHTFDARVLFINNVNSYAEVEALASQCVQRGTIDKFYRAEEGATQVLEHFGLTKEELGSGYVYSICELASIYMARTQYLVHYSGDSRLECDLDWISSGIRILQERSDIVVVNPCWNRNYAEAKSTSSEDLGDYYVGYGFSDQCYLIRVDEFRMPIYQYRHQASERYPGYGGESFEKRVDAWMQCTGKKRATLKNISYLHPA